MKPTYKTKLQMTHNLSFLTESDTSQRSITKALEILLTCTSHNRIHLSTV